MKLALLNIVVISKAYLKMKIFKNLKHSFGNTSFILNSKHGTQILTESIVFLILNIFFFSAVLFFVWHSTSQSSVIEETYAKKLGLMIDEMKAGTEVNFSINDLYDVMEKNKFYDFPIHVENSTITVKVIAGKGYTFRFFSSVVPVISINQNQTNKILSIRT